MSVKQLCDLGPFLNNSRTEFISDEFNSYTSGGLWTSFTTNSGTTAWDSNSRILHTTGAVAGNFTGIKSTNAVFLPSSSRPGFVQGRVTYTNQATTTGVPFFGVSSTTTLTMTSGLDPTASYSGALIYKRNGDTVWSVQSSNGSTKTTTLTNIVGTDGSYDLRIDFSDADGANCYVVYTINGVLATDANNRPIKHTLAYSALAAMLVVSGVQTGASAAQTCYLDYAVAGQLRYGL